jgi:hypothetical protein
MIGHGTQSCNGHSLHDIKQQSRRNRRRQMTAYGDAIGTSEDTGDSSFPSAIKMPRTHLCLLKCDHLGIQLGQPSTSHVAFELHLNMEISSLLSQLMHHGLIEEFTDAHILTHALPSPGLYHELTGKVLYWCWFQRAEDNTLV